MYIVMYLCIQLAYFYCAYRNVCTNTRIKCGKITQGSGYILWVQRFLLKKYTEAFFLILIQYSTAQQ